MLWLAMKIAFAGPIGEVEGAEARSASSPLRRFSGVNPKAWVAIWCALAAYAPMTDMYARSVALMVGLFRAITIRAPAPGHCSAPRSSASSQIRAPSARSTSSSAIDELLPWAYPKAKPLKGAT